MADTSGSAAASESAHFASARTLVRIDELAGAPNVFAGCRLGGGDMQELEVHSFGEYHQLITQWRSRVLYRGVRSTDYRLIPSVGRYWSKWQGLGRSVMHLLYAERDALEVFKLEAAAFLPGARNDLEWLALAQHHGMPTRLLDWTWNPLCALYFAVDPTAGPHEKEADAAVYVLSTFPGEWLGAGTEADFNPLAVDQFKVYVPPRHSPRMVAQSSVLTLHPDPTQSFERKELYRIRIPQNLKRELRQILFEFHVTPKSLFPGLSGLALNQRLWHFEQPEWADLPAT